MIPHGVLGIAMTILIMAPARADPSYIMFDVPGASSTVASGIDSSGNVGGYYATLKGRCRSGCGYTRAADGTVSTFEVKGCASGLQMRGMNASGDMVGFCLAKMGAFSFVRSADGAISRVRNMKGSTATLNRISGNGIAGGYFYSVYGNQPFLRMPDGSKHLLKGAKTKVGSVEGINASGVLTGGIAAVPSDPSKAFIYIPGEKIQEFSVPNFAYTSGGAIDDAIDVAGRCSNPTGPAQVFLRHPDGTFDVFDVGVGDKGVIVVRAIAIVDTDLEIVGTAAKDANEHSYGFIRHENGTTETFDISGNNAPFAGTIAMDANASGAIVGYYVDHRGEYHAYIRTP